MSDISLETFSGEVVVDELARLREEFPRTGRYPVLLGDEDDCDQIQECLEFAADDGLTQTAIDVSSREIDAAAWLSERLQPLQREREKIEGKWPFEDPGTLELLTHLDPESGEPKPEVAIGLLALTHPWEAFAVLQWGGWNECPEAAEHCALHRYWGERYGAEVVSITGDCVQCWVARPPSTQEEALKLAWEHFAYCGTIVEQGTETVAALAAALLESEFWYFWWD